MSLELNIDQVPTEGSIPEKFYIFKEPGHIYANIMIKSQVVLQEQKYNNCLFFSEKIANIKQKDINKCLLSVDNISSLDAKDFKIVDFHNDYITLLYKDTYPITLEKDYFTDFILSGGVGENLTVNKNLIFANIKSTNNFIVENGYLHKQIIKYNKLKNVKTTNINKIVPGTIYMTKKSEKELYLGNFYTTEYRLSEENYKELQEINSKLNYSYSYSWDYSKRDAENEKIYKEHYEAKKNILINEKYNKIKSKAFVSITIDDNSNETKKEINRLLNLKGDSHYDLYNLNFKKSSSYKEAIGTYDIPKDFIVNLRKKYISFLNKELSATNVNTHQAEQSLNKFLDYSRYFNLYEFTEKERKELTYGDIICWL